MTAATLARIEKYIRRARMSPSRFGKEAGRDPQLVFDLRRGRRLRRPTEARLCAWLDAAEKKLEGARCRRR